MASELPQSLSDSGEWHEIGTDTDEMEFGVAAVTVETTLYGHRSTAVERADLEGGRREGEGGGPDEGSDEDGNDIPIRSLFVIDLSSNPSLSAVGLAPSAVLGTAAEKATDLFVDRLEDDGIVVADGGDRTASEFDRGDGTVGRWYTLSVSYPVVSADAAVEAEAETDTDELHNPRIDAETHLAIWPTDDAYRMAGGTVPLRISDDAPAEIANALEVDAGRDREAIVELVRTVGLEGESEEGDDAEGEDESEDGAVSDD